jgi:predicted 2-oxoglutarate/Fe(II)-dependent dioxygenase YbiX
LYIKNHLATKSIGSGIFFPPDVVHRVTKVTSGTRYCLIGHGWGVLNRK